MQHVRFGPELLDRLVGFLTTSVPGAAGAGLNLFEDGAGGRTVAARGVAGTVDPLQWELGSGPLLDAGTTEQVVLSDDLGSDVRWPRLCAQLAGRGASRPLGAVSMPGSWDDNGPVLITLYVDHPPTAADLAQLDRVEPMLASGLAVVEYCDGATLRAEQMIEMTRYRRVIEQAKGLVIGAAGCGAGQAFAVLERASQHFDVKVRDLAVALVEHVGDVPAEPPDDKLFAEERAPEPAVRRPAAAAVRAAELTWAALLEQSSGPTA